MIAPSALYAHVPLCRSKCSYCDFFSLPAASLPEGAADRLVDSILRRAFELSERFEVSAYRTVYIGGGTPTILSAPQLGRLLNGLAGLARGAAEWTVEANPESLTPERLEVIAKSGVTRLSLGVQSLDDWTLALLGRPHDAAGAERALRLAAGSGLAISADLIAAVPLSKACRPGALAPARSLADEASRLVELGAGHLSIYDLVVEEGTRIAEALRRGELERPGEDEAWEERAAAEALLSSAGFRRYEVSNYAPSGSECAHNLAYWRMDSYIGAGPGAVSTIAGIGGPGYADGASFRVEECRDLAGYPDRAAELAREERIAPRDAAFESIMMGFRTRFGVDLDVFEERFGVDLHQMTPAALAAWSDRLVPGWGGGRRLALDDRGLDLLNRFLADCLAEIEAEAGTAAGPSGS